jgi:hypothetical protein
MSLLAAKNIAILRKNVNQEMMVIIVDAKNQIDDVDLRKIIHRVGMEKMVNVDVMGRMEKMVRTVKMVRMALFLFDTYR